MRGDALDEAWGRDRQWAMTANDIERLDGAHPIAVNDTQLLHLRRAG